MCLGFGSNPRPLKGDATLGCSMQEDGQLHLVFIHQMFNGPKDIGSTRHYEMFRILVGEGFKVTVITSNINYRTGRLRPSCRHRILSSQNLDGVNVLYAYAFPFSNRGLTFRLFSFLTFCFSSVIAFFKVTGAVHVVMASSPPLSQAVVGWFFSRIKKAVFVPEIRDLWPAFLIDMGVLKNKALIYCFRMAERFIYRGSDFIIVNSPGFRPHIEESGDVDCQRIELIPNGVDLRLFEEIRGKGRISGRRRLGVEGKFVVTYAGAIGRANNLGIVLEAAEKLRELEDLTILLVGDGPEREGLGKQIRVRRLSNVKLLPALPKDLVPELLASSDVGLALLMDIPMFKTVYPNKIFDYMAAARPVLFGIDGVIRVVVEDAGAGIFVRPGDSADLVRGILTLYHDREEAVRMGERGRSYVEEHFSRQAIAEDLALALNRMCQATRDSVG